MFLDDEDEVKKPDPEPGQLWKMTDARSRGNTVFRKIVAIRDKEHECDFLEYAKGCPVPTEGWDGFASFKAYFDPSSVDEAVRIGVDVPGQDAMREFRAGQREKVGRLASAMGILAGKTVLTVYVSADAVCLGTDDGASYEIAITPDGFSKRQTGLPDPW